MTDEELTDALNRNTSELRALRENTEMLWKKIGEYAEAMNNLTKELIEARNPPKKKWRW